MSFLDTQHKRKSMAITVIIHHDPNTLIILCWAILLRSTTIENGIAINFGTMDTGSGKIQPSKKVNTAPKPKVITTSS